MLIYKFNANKGSYLDQVSKVQGVNSNGLFKKTSKGIAWEGSGTNTKVELNQTISLGTIFSFTCIVRVTDNSIASMAIGGYSDNSYPLLLAPSTTTIHAHDGVNFVSDSRPELFDGNWHIVTVTRNGTSVYFYIDGVAGSEKTLATNNSISVDRLFLRGASLHFKGLCSKIEIDNIILSQTQINNLYTDFLRPPVTGSSIYKNDYPLKANDYSLISDIIAGYNCIPSSGSILVDISGNGKNIDLNTGIISTKNGIWLGNNTQAENIGNVKSMSFRFKPITLNDKLFEGSAATDMIYLNSGTLIHTFDNCYVDGVLGTTISTADKYYTVTLTSTTNIDFSAFKAGINDTIKSAYELNDLIFYDAEINVSKIAQYHNQFVKPTIIEDFNFSAVGNFPREFQQGTGTYEVDELAVADSVLGLPIGTKFLKNTVASTCAVQNTNAYGVVFEGDLYKGVNGNVTRVYIISNDTFATLNYDIRFEGANAISLRRSGSILLKTASSYVNDNTWYRIKVTRSQDGEFTVYIKGGAFGNDYVLVDVSGGSGTNPITDNTHTTSKFTVWDLDVGDRQGFFKTTNGIKQ